MLLREPLDMRTLTPPSPEISVTPLWTAEHPLPEPSTAALPRQVDCAIIGAGYTGLAAARETAAAGRSTLVLDSAGVGEGCSGRNGGQVAHSIKPTMEGLSARFGRDLAFRILQEGFAAMSSLRDLAGEPNVDIGWRPSGSYYGAHTRRHFDLICREADNQPRGLEQRIEVVSRANQPAEINTDFYHGGLIYRDDASVHPMRLLLTLYERARSAGAAVIDHCPATSMQSSGNGYQLQTPRGVVSAEKVLIATNGYTGLLSPWHRRRVIPVGSYQIATARLGADQVRTLIPQGRNIVDTRRVVVYFRPSPDGERIIFGGRAALAEKNPLLVVPRLRSMLAQIFPSLNSVAIDHAWAGTVAFTFDKMAHLGRRGGIYYCMGYCGQGVPTAPYFGKRIGQQMAGLKEGATALDGLAFPTKPFYSGVPWFLAPSILSYRILDALGV